MPEFRTTSLRMPKTLHEALVAWQAEVTTRTGERPSLNAFYVTAIQDALALTKEKS